MAGFASVAEPMQEDKVRGKPEKFADHCSQATLFYCSQTAVEQRHIVGAFRFELSKVTVPAIRQRVVSVLRNVDEGLAQAVADSLLGADACGHDVLNDFIEALARHRHCERETDPPMV